MIQKKKKKKKLIHKAVLLENINVCFIKSQIPKLIFLLKSVIQTPHAGNRCGEASVLNTDCTIAIKRNHNFFEKISS